MTSLLEAPAVIDTKTGIKKPKMAVIIPVWHELEMTHALVSDCMLEHDRIDLFIVDNGNSYVPLQPSWEWVLRPEENLGWLRGCNYGYDIAQEGHYQYYCFLNNDTRLSDRFFEGAIAAMDYNIKAGIVGPIYDDVWAQQSKYFNGPAQSYNVPKSVIGKGYTFEHEELFIDGTCMFLRKSMLDDIGLLDEKHFGKFGWGAEMDLCIRAKNAGYQVLVTERSYLNHYRQITARQVNDDYGRLASEEMNTGMTEIYGPGWQTKLGI